MEQVLSALLSFAGGSLITAIGFMIAFTGRVSKLETTVLELVKRIEKIGPIPCLAHANLSEQVKVLQEKAENADKEITTLRSSR